ncbi:NAD+ synthase [Agaribacterium haliotis]|uniref:NAD+ synthase n=1 Tax=Agaribacterium haliotis TaxID=2013869 RepID=UPI000BB588B4|nr:NAD+ synthase [Agaribacterium haliotis]
MSKLSLALAQLNPLVGDIDGNAQLILQTARDILAEKAVDLVLFPELTLCGYPPEDLLLRPSLQRRVDRALQVLIDARLPCALVVGYPRQSERGLLNMAGVIVDGQLLFEYAKRCLPNYQVFDEKRYFVEGQSKAEFEFKGVKLALSICEDIWDGSPLEELKTENIDLVLNLNASPFHRDKQAERERLVAKRAEMIQAPIAYVNQVGGQDELVFDGGSFAINADASLAARASLFKQQNILLELDQGRLSGAGDQAINRDYDSDKLACIYDALVLGVRDYVNKNGFKGVVLGLSGGIDSALTLAVAVDALGAERVQAVMMPFHYTSQMSKDDASEQARRMGVEYHSIGIEHIYEQFMLALEPVLAGSKRDTTEENLQARSRGVLLMAISNKLGYLVLTTGNKSEMSVGYATLYGDMAGGLDVLKDVPKVTVFELARYRNTRSDVIPENVITRPPSAELAPDQVDSDSLPDYEVLDQILQLYVEEDQSAEAIIARGFDAADVRKVLRLVDVNEYKRRQAPVGIRISSRAFGRDRRYPITNGWKIGD